MIAALSFALLLTWGHSAHHEADRPATSSPPTLPPIPVAVFAPGDVTDSLVKRVCDEAGAIWRPAGISFEWHRVTAADAQPGLALSVTIDGRRAEPYREPAALGWIPFAPDGPQPSIHLSRSTVETLLLRTPGVEDRTTASHEALVGRALGRALAHEIGHYLLRSKAHTVNGLMRAQRSSLEFFGTSRTGFEPNAEERAVASREVRRPAPMRGRL